jgi:two-component sensor histidine kinase
VTTNDPIRVLLIEDNPGDARLIQEMLRDCPAHCNAAVHCAESLAAARKYLDSQPVDIVLLDLGLPDSTGLETFLAVQHHMPNKPIIVLTGLHDDETAGRALRDGAQDYLIKGQIDADRLLRSVRYAIERKRAEEQLRAVSHVQRLLLSELDHRVRNNLASLLTLVDMGQRQYTEVERFAESMRQRVQTMATVHTVLSRSQWTSISIDRLLSSLVPPELFDRLHLEGPPFLIPVRQVAAFGMVFNEFITNSTKYGALGSKSGSVHVAWTLQRYDEPSNGNVPRSEASALVLEWREVGGPAVTPPESPGVGTRIISGLAQSELKGNVELTYPTAGVVHRLTVLLESFDDQAAESGP